MLSIVNKKQIEFSDLLMWIDPYMVGKETF